MDGTILYTFIYKCVKAGVYCWVGWGWNLMYYIIMPTIMFFLFLQLNGSVNGLKPRTHFNPIQYFTIEPLCTVSSPFFVHKNPPNPLQKIRHISLAQRRLKSFLMRYYLTSNKTLFLDICPVFPSFWKT